MSCARPPNFLLRKQKSLAYESVCQPTINMRERRLRLQKQYSIDQSDFTKTVTTQRSSNGQQQHSVKKGTVVHNSWNCNNPSPEASLRIFTAIKNKTQCHESESNQECGLNNLYVKIDFFALVE